MEDNKKINEKKPEDLADEQMEDVSGGWRNCEGSSAPPVPVKFLVRDDVIPQAGKDADFLRSQFRGQWVDAKAYNKQCDGQYYSVELKYYNVVLKTAPGRACELQRYRQTYRFAHTQPANNLPIICYNS